MSPAKKTTTARRPGARPPRRDAAVAARRPASKKNPPSRPAPPADASRKPAKAATGRGRGHRAATPEHPLGMGVADGFAMRRLNAPAKLTRTPKGDVREIGWAAFGDTARALAARIGETFLPDVVVGIAKGGVFVGGALAAALGADFHALRVEKRRRDAGEVEASTGLPELRGKRVLVVDDVASSGGTLRRACAAVRAAGAREARTAVLVVRPGGARPDWFSLETDALVLFGWDYQLDHAGGPVAEADDPGEVGV